MFLYRRCTSTMQIYIPIRSWQSTKTSNCLLAATMAALFAKHHSLKALKFTCKQIEKSRWRQVQKRLPQMRPAKNAGGRFPLFTSSIFNINSTPKFCVNFVLISSPPSFSAPTSAVRRTEKVHYLPAPPPQIN